MKKQAPSGRRAAGLDARGNPSGLKPAPRVLSNLPEPLGPLRELAYNLWWSWDADGKRLFESIDPRLWQASGHNPVALLRRLPRRRMQQLAADRTFVAQVRRAGRRMDRYLRRRMWFQRHYGQKVRRLVAYFSMEFGLHESLPIFAGGLGVLAGDHFKSASDLGLPLVGVSIFWRRGYTRQRIDAAGRQTEIYDRLSPDNLPLIEVTSGTARRRVRIRIPLGSDALVARAWRLAVGRTSILLLDTNLPQNAPRHRRLTDRLYSGDRDVRIRQEILLGVGGWKLLRALGLPVVACHLNEGHAAICSLQRVEETIRERECSFAEAARRIAASTIFTTHTPVPEGNETFAPDLVLRYFDRYARRLGISREQLLALGRGRVPLAARRQCLADASGRPADGPPAAGADFGMTPLALRLADRANGVSELHGQVSRRMWRGLWPRRKEDRVPIGSITNGIHLRTWLHPQMAELLDEYLPTGWLERQDQPAVWRAVEKIPDERLWKLHLALKAELVDFVRARLQTSRSGPQTRPKSVLDPEALTIGFARRFATYKRATLIFSDLRRLERMVNHPRRPVQIIFAGKAHPADASGKALVARIVKHARSRRFQGRVVFLEDYDMEMARRLVAGVDVWLNNPRRPQEASGTSGMKPALHGGLNLSILDGWWAEGCRDGVNGWAIGQGLDHDGSQAADQREARALYQRLEREVIPLYYDRPRHNRPTKWIRRMKRALATVPPAFNAHRMVKQYLKRYYLSALRAARP